MFFELFQVRTTLRACDGAAREPRRAGRLVLWRDPAGQEGLLDGLDQGGQSSQVTKSLPFEQGGLEDPKAICTKLCIKSIYKISMYIYI